MYFDIDAIDPTLPDVTLKIGGKVRHLAFDYHSIVTVEKLTGLNLLSEAFEGSFTNLGALLYAALLRDDSTITLDEVGSWITFRTAPIISQAVISAWIGSIPEPTKDEAPGEAVAAATDNPAA